MAKYDEEDLIRNLFNRPEEIGKAILLNAEEFTEPHLGEIWEAIKNTAKASWSYTDLLPVKFSPKARQTFLQLADPNYGINPIPVKNLIIRIKQEAKARLGLQLANLGATITPENQEDRIAEIKKLTAILEEPVSTEPDRNQTQRAITWINALGQDPNFLASHSPALNDYIDGFSKGRLYLLAARPAIGKTAVALNLAWGLQGRAKVVFYSLEMTEEELLARVASIETGLPNHLVKPKTDPETSAKLAKDFLPVLENSGFEIVAPKEGFTISQLRADTLKRKSEGNLDFLVIDQLDKIRPSGKLTSATEYEIFSKHSTALKQLALELETPILLLCQINRDGNEEPSLKNLKGSGQLEQDADLVFILHSPAEGYERTELSFRIAKNRHGKTGKIFFGWQGDLLRITEPKQSFFKANKNPADQAASYRKPTQPQTFSEPF